MYKALKSSGNGKHHEAKYGKLLTPFLFGYFSFILQDGKHIIARNNLTFGYPRVTGDPFTPLQYQGFFIRGFANILDQLLVSVPFIGYGLITHWDEPTGLYVTVISIVFLLYLTIAEAFWSETFGKKLLGIKVMMSDGRKCTVMAAMIRNLFRLVDALVGAYIISLFVMTLTPKRQRIGDLLARTVVVKI